MKRKRVACRKKNPLKTKRSTGNTYKTQQNVHSSVVFLMALLWQKRNVCTTLAKPLLHQFFQTVVARSAKSIVMMKKASSSSKAELVLPPNNHIRNGRKHYCHARLLGRQLCWLVIVPLKSWRHLHPNGFSVAMVRVGRTKDRPTTSSRKPFADTPCFGKQRKNDRLATARIKWAMLADKPLHQKLHSTQSLTLFKTFVCSLDPSQSKHLKNSSNVRPWSNHRRIKYEKTALDINRSKYPKNYACAGSPFQRSWVRVGHSLCSNWPTQRGNSGNFFIWAQDGLVPSEL